MGIRTTITLDEDVLERIKAESRSRGASFRETLNELLRLALVTQKPQPIRGRFRVRPSHMGYRPGLNYDSIESLLEYGEGEVHR
jgi:hypothetical protein